MARVVVVLPTFNERENIAPLVERLSQARQKMVYELHLLFVDDGSPDGTADAIREEMKAHEFVHLLERGSKKGLGTAYLDGFAEAIPSLDPSAFVQMDSDLQHPPETVGPLVDAVMVGGADVALGSRYIPGGSFEGLEGSRRLVSSGANWMARTLLGLGVRDTTTGFKALDRNAVDTLLMIKLHSRGFIYQVESLYALKQNGLKIVEIPMVFGLREKGASKLSDKEVWEFLRSVLSMRFRNYRVKARSG